MEKGCYQWRLNLIFLKRLLCQKRQYLEIFQERMVAED